MTDEVYIQFFAERKKLATLLGVAENLVGLYSTYNGQSIGYTVRDMIKPHLDWDRGRVAYLGYPSNSATPVQVAAVREYFDLSRLGYPYGYFYLERLAGCCGAAHLSSMTTNRPGMGKIMLAIAERAAYNNGYRLITGTVIEGYGGSSLNSRARHLIKKFGWSEHRAWKNGRTGNTVYLCSKELTADNAGRRIDDGAGKSSNQGSSVKVATVARYTGFSAQ